MKSHIINPFEPIQLTDSYPYQCSLCGDCCRNVEQSVALESADVYRLARFLRDSGSPVRTIGGLMDEYTTLGMVEEEFPVPYLKTVGPDHACVFLRENRCTVQDAKPRVCRLYPFLSGPGNLPGAFEYIRCQDRHSAKHFHGNAVSIRDWMDSRFTAEDRIFIAEHFQDVKKLGRLFLKLPEIRKIQALFPMLVYLYENYDLDEPFQPQYEQNARELLLQMQAMLADAE